jgi:cobalt-precorrin-5B (C1)-methyltransferase
MAAGSYRKPGSTATGELRRGWTTGACAAAAARAAASALLGRGFPDPVTIRLPRGGEATFALAEARLGAGAATAAIVKDAGDDPDVTHGCLVRVTVRHGPAGTGVTFRAGEGVGTVTRAGLPVPPGEPAINPVPRRMLREAVAEAAGGPADVEVTVAIPGGEALARRTLNARLGIVGGLSILGTTGIVIPYSCSSWIHSIHRGIDVARAAGLEHVAAATGRTSEATVQRLHGLPDMALIDMGDFVGATLKYLRRHPLPRLTLAGGIGKLAKLAQGHLDLHSRRSTLDRAALARTLAAAGAPAPLLARAAETPTVAALLDGTERFALGNVIAIKARYIAREAVGDAVGVEVVVVDRDGGIVGRAEGW